MTITAWTITFDIRYLAACIALLAGSVWFAFKLGAIIRRVQGPSPHVDGEGGE